MSTRCQVRIVRNGYPLNMYHHHDGYFSGVGMELKKWLEECVEKNKGKVDSWLDEGLLLSHIRCHNEYEPAFCTHGDIEYFYLLDFDRQMFKAYHTVGFSPWVPEGDDDYDQYKPWYDQIPRHDVERDILNDDMHD